METDLSDNCKAAQIKISSRIKQVEDVLRTRTVVDSLAEERERSPGGWCKNLDSTRLLTNQSMRKRSERCRR